MGLLFGRVNIEDRDLQAIGIMVEESNVSARMLAKAIEAIAKAIEVVAKVIGAKKASAFWGLIKIE